MNNEDIKQLKASIQPCDPELSEILINCYIALNQRKEQNQMNFFESGVYKSVHDLMSDNLSSRQRQTNAIYKSFNDVLRRKTDSTWIQEEKELYDHLRGSILLDLFSIEGEMSKTLGKYAQHLLKLDYLQELPVFDLDGAKKNIFNYIAFLLESLAEKLASSTLSKKVVEKILDGKGSGLCIVTDLENKIRFTSTAFENLLQKDFHQFKGKNVFTIIPELNEFPEKNNNGRFEEVLDLNLGNTLMRGVLVSKELVNDLEEEELSEVVYQIEPNQMVADFDLSLFEDSNTVNDLIDCIQLLRKDNSLDESRFMSSALLKRLYVQKDKLTSKLTRSKTNSNWSLEEVINFEPLIQQVIEELSHRIADKEITISYNIKKNSPLYCNYETIQSILKNLLKNAVQSVHENISVSTIQLTIEDSKYGTKISVSNNGATIPKKYYNRIFERGFQIDPIKSTGLGLGLYFTKRSVQNLGGNIEVESTENQTTFTILLPI